MTRHAAFALTAGTLAIISLAGCATERNGPSGQAAAPAPDHASTAQQDPPPAPPPSDAPEAQAAADTTQAAEESQPAEDDNIPAGFIPGGRIAEAIEASQRTGRPIFVVASATWCGPCQQYRTRTLATAMMAETLNSTTVPVYVDIDEDEEAVNFIRESGANFRAIPFTVLIEDGQVVESFTGVRNPTQLTDWVNRHAARG